MQKRLAPRIRHLRVLVVEDEPSLREIIRLTLANFDCVLAGDGHEGAIYEITGPEFSTFREAAALSAEFSGRPVEYRVCTAEEKLAIWDAMGVQRDYVDGMFNEGTGAWCSNEMITYEMAIRDGYFALCSGHVELLTGQRPKSLRQVFEENRAVFARFHA